MEQQSGENYEYDPFQAQDHGASLPDGGGLQLAMFRHSTFAAIGTLIFCGLAVFMTLHHSPSDDHIAAIPEVASEVQRLQSVSNRGANCWKPCGKIGGHCPRFCGAGNACCRRGARFDPPECRGVARFITNHHECVVPVANVPLKHQFQDCWNFCGGRPGPCNWCGSGNLCCRYGAAMDPPACRRVSYFPTRQFHTCVQPGPQPRPSPTMQPSLPPTVQPRPSPTMQPTLPPTVQPSLPPVMQPSPPPSNPGALTFYMYRAQSHENYPFENVNSANVGGVLRYMHDEVVFSCPRKFQITRILRFKVTVHATSALPNSNFGPFVAFDQGRCTVPNCPNLWARYGYVVGCQRQGTSVAHYPNGVWFSVPGSCPSQKFWKKSPQCKQREPGGQCNNPDGSRDCTWHAEAAGEISVDELGGIKNYNARCREGFREYDVRTDRGVGTDFWNGKRDPASCARRESRLRQLFETKYPLSLKLGDPPCDWWR